MLDCILIVDDDPIAIFLDKNVISKMGISKHIETVNNGQEGIIYLKSYYDKNQKCPELILVDLKMPDMNGFEFIEIYQKLRIHGPDDKVVAMLTSSEDPNDVEKVKSLGVNDYLVKPLKKEHIMSLINKYFQKYFN